MTTPAPTPTPPAPPPPPSMPPEVEAHITKRLNEGITAALAARDAAAGAKPAPAITNIRDLRMDPPEGRVWEARAGVAIKAAYLARAKMMGIPQQSEKPVKEIYDHLEDYLLKCKSVGQFASIFGAGGEKLPVVESSELIEFLRPASILLKQPGLRRVSGYGGKFVVGKLNDVPVVYWVAEGVPADKSKLDGGLLELGAHKFMGLTRISNDLLRRGDSQASADVGAELQKSAALHVDKSGLFGKGNKTPRGIQAQTKDSMFLTPAGSSQQNMITDMDALPATIEGKNLDLDDSCFYFMQPSTFWKLRSQRDAGGWIFDGLRDMKNPTINGYPVVRSTVLAGKNFVGFGLASQLYFGSAAEMTINIGESGNDFSEDFMTTRMVGYADWVLRHDVAFSFLQNVPY